MNQKLVKKSKKSPSAGLSTMATKSSQESPIYILWDGYQNIPTFRNPSHSRPGLFDLDSTTRIIVRVATDQFIPLELSGVNPFPDSNHTDRAKFCKLMFKKAAKHITKQSWCTTKLATQIKNALLAFQGANDDYRTVVKRIVSLFILVYPFLKLKDWKFSFTKRYVIFAILGRPPLWVM